MKYLESGQPKPPLGRKFIAEQLNVHDDEQTNALYAEKENCFQEKKFKIFFHLDHCYILWSLIFPATTELRIVLSRRNENNIRNSMLYNIVFFIFVSICAHSFSSQISYF